MKIAFCVFVVLCLVNVSIVSSRHTTKACAEYKITAMQGFKKERYLGDWYIHQMYDFDPTPDFPGSAGYNCFVILRTPRPDGTQNFSEVVVDSGVLLEVTASAVTTFKHPGEGRYTFLSTVIPEYDGDYFILDTDYLTYTIETKCTDVKGGGSEVELYVMGRAPLIPFLSQKKINKIIADHHFNDNPIRTLNTLSCPFELIGSDGLLAGLLKLVTKLVGGLLGILG